MSTQLEDAFAAAIERDTRFGYLDRTVVSRKAVNPRLIVNDDGGSMLRAIRDELRHSSSFAFSVAFVTPRAIALLKQEMVDFEGKGLIVTSNYLGFNTPQAFAELLSLEALGIEIRLHTDKAFHPKGYVFNYDDRVTAILGSSNLTESALVQNHEWNLRVSATRNSDLADQLNALVVSQLSESRPLTKQWIDDYAASYIPPTRRTPPVVVIAEDTNPADLLVPNVMQLEALAEIQQLRHAGASRALVISATGTGKTILAALDVRVFNPQRMLFMVHREQILDRAIEEFQRVLGLPASDFGKLTGGQRDAGKRFTFATVQTLSRPEVLASLDPKAFDYVLVDEVHHVGAATYQRVVDHFSPQFMLGVTATPERNDGFNVFELFDFNVPYEIRLGKALESDMLAPFHYYGVADVSFDNGSTISVDEGIERLTSRVRVDHILRALETYMQAGVPPRGLIFCSRVDEAHRLSEELNASSFRGRRLRTVALSGADSIGEREAAVDGLTRGELDYILTVDVFNEGVDIPAVNQVVMLRQTQSSIVFVQQLGRGLRKHAGKEYLVVIDFIGNYANNYMIPIALFGDDSLNKESVRQHLVSAEEKGVLPGMSSVRFDRISQARVLDAIAAVKLDSLQNIRRAFDTLERRLGRVPDLRDFHRFESADPVVVAATRGNYPTLVARFKKSDSGLSDSESRLLSFATQEVLDAKRPHELAVVRELIRHGKQSLGSLRNVMTEQGISADDRTVDSAARTLMLEFYTQQERERYRAPIAKFVEGDLTLTREFLASYARNDTFAHAIDDLLDTGDAIVRERYLYGEPFVVGRQYSRKDACRLLNWSSNSSSTVYGYKVDRATKSCPIFVTLHKAEDVSASTAYEDELLDRQNMKWFTRSRRTLKSAEVAAIVSRDVVPYVFAKKSDAEGSAFYFLGRAEPHDAVDTTMLDDAGKPLNVVTMRLQFERPIDSAIYDYFHPIVTD